jgi:hypothetical protein
VHAAVGHILTTHGRIGASSTHARGQGIRARRTTVLLSWEATTAITRRTIGTSARTSAHGRRAHAEARGSIHGRRECRIGDDGGTCTASTTAKTGRVLRKVVVSTAVLTALPVSSTERNNTSTSTHMSTAHSVAVTVTVTHVVLRRAHHAWVASVSVAAIGHGVTAWRALLHGRERASETSGTALEVGETTRGAVPVTRARPVLAGRERCDDV